MRRFRLALFVATLTVLAALIGLWSTRQSDLGAPLAQTRPATAVSPSRPPDAGATVAVTHDSPGPTAMVSVLPTPVPAPASPLPTPTAGQSAAPLAPDFTLRGAQGITITLSAYRGESNVVLVFYRGQT